jgi:molybdenum cofactor cytidylyltransferase
MIAGIVLAAGLSRRMGRTKAFLQLGGRSFLERAVGALRDGGCDPVVVVAGPHGDAGADEVALTAVRLGAVVARNPDAESPQVASLRAGLGALGAAVEAVVVTPVDVPRVDAETVRALAAVFETSRAPLARPFDGVRHGHPVLFSRALWPELMADPLPEGARSVIHAHAGERAEVRVRALPADVDTPEEYRRLLEGEG